MPVLKDQSNKRIIRNYVEMPDKPMFSTKEIVSATGVSYNEVSIELRQLELNGVIVRVSKRVNRYVYFRKVEADEILMQELSKKPVSQVAIEKGVSKEAIYQQVRKMSVKPKVAKASKKPNSRGKSFDKQLIALAKLSDGKWHYGFDLKAYETLRLLLKKEWVICVKEKWLNTYAITSTGLEVLNAKS